MSKTNYLQAVISDLQRTAGPYTNFRLMQCSKKQRHSIASSARASSVNRSCLIWITTEGRCFVLLSPTYGSQFPL